MRTIALSVTVCGLVMAVATMTLADDFDVLLKDLSFGNDKPIEETLTLDPASSATVDILTPSGTGFVMPETQSTAAAPASAPIEAPQEPTAGLELQPVEDAADDIDFAQVFDSEEAIASDTALAPIESLSEPQVAEPELIESTLVQATEPVQAEDAVVEVDSETEAVPTPMPLEDEPMIAAPIVDPVGVHYDGSCGQPCGGCDHQITCMPHLPPQLPHSTLLQYFRANKCYSNVWDGYQQHCGLGHHHVHGTCDCFKHKHGGCDSCDRCGH